MGRKKKQVIDEFDEPSPKEMDEIKKIESKIIMDDWDEDEDFYNEDLFPDLN